MSKHADIDSLLRKGEIALSRAKLADSDPPKRGRDELVSVSDVEEITGSVAAKMMETAMKTQGNASHGEIQTPLGFTFRGPVALLPWLLLVGVLVYFLAIRK